MPIFEYKCRRCGKIFEILLFRKDEEVEVVCPACKCVKADKVPSLFRGKIEWSPSSFSGMSSSTASSSSCSSCSSTSCST